MIFEGHPSILRSDKDKRKDDAVRISVRPGLILLLAAIGSSLSGCREAPPPGPETIVKMSDGMYHLRSKPDSLDIKTADGGIVFSREKGFTVGVAYTGKDFFWSDNGEDICLCYDGNFCMDFNRDLVFDFFWKEKKHFIVFGQERLEVHQPDFRTMRAVGVADGKTYGWDGGKWVILP